MTCPSPTSPTSPNLPYPSAMPTASELGDAFESMMDTSRMSSTASPALSDTFSDDSIPSLASMSSIGSTSTTSPSIPSKASPNHMIGFPPGLTSINTSQGMLLETTSFPGLTSPVSPTYPTGPESHHFTNYVDSSVGQVSYASDPVSPFEPTPPSPFRNLSSPTMEIPATLSPIAVISDTPVHSMSHVSLVDQELGSGFYKSEHGAPSVAFPPFSEHHSNLHTPTPASSPSASGSFSSSSSSSSTLVESMRGMETCQGGLNVQTMIPSPPPQGTQASSERVGMVSVQDLHAAASVAAATTTTSTMSIDTSTSTSTPSTTPHTCSSSLQDGGVDGVAHLFGPPPPLPPTDVPVPSASVPSTTGPVRRRGRKASSSSSSSSTTTTATSSSSSSSSSTPSTATTSSSSLLLSSVYEEHSAMTAATAAALQLEEERMDEETDLQLPDADTYARLTPKERRQLRNKISARNFRSRRKRYVANIEKMVAEQRADIARLTSQLRVADDTTRSLREELRTLRKQCQDMMQYHQAALPNSVSSLPSSESVQTLEAPMTPAGSITGPQVSMVNLGIPQRPVLASTIVKSSGQSSIPVSATSSSSSSSSSSPPTAILKEEGKEEQLVYHVDLHSSIEPTIFDTLQEVSPLLSYSEVDEEDGMPCGSTRWLWDLARS
ncbi:MAG: hypothetical protein DHS80DRAFT_33507 [Piptocephalis tieghemiana]|nr:MAG: hypothetical protein DHS80DRAFT_33507 [Piptocephalis tieghemiana]